nr:MAG TPA: hypothetical protein [Caudoviricetes sp.]
MAPVQKVGQTIVSLFTNQGDSRPQKLIKPLFHCLLAKISTAPPPKSGGPLLFIVYCSNGKNPKSLIINHLN